MKTSIFSLLICISQITFGQTIYSRNFNLSEYGTFSYVPTSNTILFRKEKAQLLVKSKGEERLIKGNFGLITPKGDKIVAFTYGSEHSTIHMYDILGNLIKEKDFEYSIIDICVDDSEGFIYALSGNVSALSECPIYSDLQLGDSTSKILKLNVDLQLETIFETHLLEENVTSLAISKSLNQIVVAGGLEGIVLNLNGELLKKFETPHASFVKNNSNGLHSILHEFSDGSYLEILKTVKDTVSISKKLKKKYILNSYVKTEIAVFKSWDINNTNSHIVTLDHSNSISIFTSSGSFIKNIKHTSNSVFVFFIDNATIGVYDSTNMLTEYNIGL